MKYLFFTATLFFLARCTHPDSDGIYKVEAAEFASLIKETNDAVVLDVRTPSEFEEGHIDKAININFNSHDFENEIDSMDSSKTIFVYCLKGGRSNSAADYMQHHGFRKIYTLNGGLRGWSDAEMPVVK